MIRRTRYGWQVANRAQVIMHQGVRWRLSWGQWPHPGTHAARQMGRVFRWYALGPVEVRVWRDPIPDWHAAARGEDR